MHSVTIGRCPANLTHIVHPATTISHCLFLRHAFSIPSTLPNSPSEPSPFPVLQLGTLFLCIYDNSNKFLAWNRCTGGPESWVSV